MTHEPRRENWFLYPEEFQTEEDAAVYARKARVAVFCGVTASLIAVVALVAVAVG